MNPDNPMFRDDDWQMRMPQEYGIPWYLRWFVLPFIKPIVGQDYYGEVLWVTKAKAFRGKLYILESGPKYSREEIQQVIDEVMENTK